MTPAHCDQELKRLKVLRGLPEDVCEYFIALQDVPDPLFTEAVSHALKTRTWFPTPVELRVDADAVAAAVPVPVAEPQYVRPPSAEPRTVRNPFTGVEHVVYVDREWKYDCEQCNDLGMETFWCGTPSERRQPWIEFRTCDRRNEHAVHEWAAPCGCREWNPTLRRRREAGAKYAQAAGKGA